MSTLAILHVAGALATTLVEQSTVTVETGITITEYRASSPSTDVWVMRVDLCADDVYVDATRDTARYATTGSWAADMDLTAATNGDFYKTDPTRVYGDAYGGGVRWASGHTGWDSAYDEEWYWEHYGWIAFGHDEVWFSHTGWVKENVAGLVAGVDNSDPTPAPPDGVLAMVSGFPELVVEGVAMVCADPEDSDCFPDRSDMRDRHPRTAMGITEDLGTFLLVVADGRTSDNAGLYGSELADIMGQLGAWEAFNLDGGGSSQLWTDDDGYVNGYDGNNYGSGARTVANHWGVFAGGRDYLPARPGHCSTTSPCGTVPGGGGVIDDADACFRGFGDPAYWRAEAAGYNGGLRWTNAFDADQPDNWAWWRTELEQAGDYEVFIYANAEYSVFDEVEYEVRAAGVDTRLLVDPSGQDGWLSIGTFTFAAGGDQWVALFDDQASNPGSDQHIVADAVKLVRVGEWCGDAICSDAERCSCEDCPITDEVEGNGLDDDCDGAVDEIGAQDSDPGAEDTERDEEADDSVGAADGPSLVRRDGVGCGCASSSWRSLSSFAVLVVLGGLRARRRDAKRPS